MCSLLRCPQCDREDELWWPVQALLAMSQTHITSKFIRGDAEGREGEKGMLHVRKTTMKSMYQKEGIWKGGGRRDQGNVLVRMAGMPNFIVSEGTVNIHPHVIQFISRAATSLSLCVVPRCPILMWSRPLQQQRQFGRIPSTSSPPFASLQWM